MQPFGYFGEEMSRMRSDELARKVEVQRSFRRDWPRWRVVLGRRMVRAGARVMGEPAGAILGRLRGGA